MRQTAKISATERHEPICEVPAFAVIWIDSFLMSFAKSNSWIKSS